MTIRCIRMLLRDNKLLRYTIYGCVRWLMLDVFKLKQRNIRKYGYEAVRIIDAVARDVDLQYFAHAGTLLGFIRDKGFISHDTDMDFAMMPDNNALSKFFYGLESNGFYFERYILLDGRLREFSMRFKEISIDFFARYYKDDTHNEFHVIGECRGDYWDCGDMPAPRKLIKYQVHGVTTFIPDNYEAILTHCYGDWHKTIREWDDKMSPKTKKDYGKHDQYLSRNRGEWIAFLEKNSL